MQCENNSSEICPGGGGGGWLAYGLLLYSFSSSFFQISLTTFQLYNVSAVFPLPSSGIFEMVMIQNNNISPFQIPDEGSGNAAETLYRTNYLIIMSAGNSLGYYTLDSMQDSQWRPCQETRHNCRSEMV